MFNPHPESGKLQIMLRNNYSESDSSETTLRVFSVISGCCWRLLFLPPSLSAASFRVRPPLNSTSLCETIGRTCLIAAKKETEDNITITIKTSSYYATRLE